MATGRTEAWREAVRSDRSGVWKFWVLENEGEESCPKLLRACAVEATSRHEDDRVYPEPGLRDVAAFVSGILSGTAVATPVTDRITLRVHESERVVVHETLDAEQFGWCLHKSCLSKEATG